MDTQRLISELKVFFEKEYIQDLLENSRKGKFSITIDFNKISHFNIDIADSFIDNPEDSFKTAEIAIEQFDLPNNNNFKVYIKNLPKSCYSHIASKRT
ncbi:hypothetical protein ACFL43_04055, partial [Thermodesulfobacteriota bacterium]